MVFVTIESKLGQALGIVQCCHYTLAAMELMSYSLTEGFFPDTVAVENRRQWDTRAPQALLQIMATADVTSTCPTMPDGESVVSYCQPAARENQGLAQLLCPYTLYWDSCHFSVTKHFTQTLFWSQ